MNTHVDYPTAMLLKEKGFDIPTQKAYINNKLFTNFEESDGEREYYFDADDFYENWNMRGWIFTEKGSGCFGCKLDNIKYFEAFSAPTIAEVVMWFYEKHGIWVSCHYNKSVTFSISIVDDCENSIGEGLFGERFKSPTEAYTKAIKHCLTNLIK